MKIIKVRTDGRYTHHGIGYTEHGGYAGTADNRWPIKLAIATELRSIKPGEHYQVEVNGVNKGEFIRQIGNLEKTALEHAKPVRHLK
jgi:hypothetical protein